MKNTMLMLSMIGVLGLSACTRVENTVAKYDKSKVYLKSDKYVGNRVKVPGDLETANIEDYYVVPPIPDQGDPKIPSLKPPKDEIAQAPQESEVS